MLVPYDDPSLKAALVTGAKGAAGSPWVIAIQNAGIQGLPHIINAVILSSASVALFFLAAGRGLTRKF